VIPRRWLKVPANVKALRLDSVTYERAWRATWLMSIYDGAFYRGRLRELWSPSIEILPAVIAYDATLAGGVS